MNFERQSESACWDAEEMPFGKKSDHDTINLLTSTRCEQISPELERFTMSGDFHNADS